MPGSFAEGAAAANRLAAPSGRHHVIRGLAFTALTVAFGLQAVRVLVPGLTWTLGDRFDQGAYVLGGAALVVFSAAFMAAWLRYLLGTARAVMVTAVVLGLLRFLLQVWWGEPALNMALAGAATALFALFLTLGLMLAREEAGARASLFAMGMIGGLMLDTAWHAATLTYDTAWQPAWQMLLATGIAVALQWLSTGGHRKPAAGLPPEPGPSVTGSLAWMGIGPFLLLQAVVLQNVARLAALTGWALPLAGLWVLVTDFLALTAVALLARRRGRWPWALLAGAVLVSASAFSNPETPWIAAVALLAGQLSAAAVLLGVVQGAAGSQGRFSVSSLAVSGGAGMVVFVSLLLAYYIAYQVTVPYANTVLEVVAAGMLAVCGLAAAPATRRALPALGDMRAALGLAVLLMVPTLVVAVAWEEPAAAPGDGFPIRVMTYNLHNGFEPGGHLDLEAQAQVMEEAQPDVLVLQEVSRGWVISGRVDMLSWLSQRLDMPYVSGPTVDPFWGNAVLSRFPIVDHENHELPPRDLFLRRGFMSVTVEVGAGETLRFIATHFHHLERDSAIRQQQARVIAGFWGGDQRTAIMGDLNARPDSAEMAILRQAKLVDAGTVQAGAARHTFSSTAPFQRIDYIWVSPDLTVSEAFTPSTTASDHLPVIAVVDR